ncbi:ABC transporter, ATP-binding protein [Methanosarcina sp. MTP4]|nr:ABC transporter, ATP-binding protein [Methanosarcina sp. MTP4]
MEDTESTEGLCLYLLYSVFSVLSVVKLSLEIGERIWALDYKSKVEKKMELCPQGGKFLIEGTYRERVLTDSFLKSP